MCITNDISLVRYLALTVDEMWPYGYSTVASRKHKIETGSRLVYFTARRHARHDERGDAAHDVAL